MPDLLATLNAAQRHGVIHAGGPLAVLAGPGTGKTTLIVRRVARLILDGVPPASIVALTFTTKAAEQLRTKLAEALAEFGGSEGVAPQAGAVNIHTYHSFGQRIIRRFPDRLGLPGNVELIDSAQRRRLLRELILSRDHLRVMAGEGADAAASHADKVGESLSDHAIEPDAALTWCATRVSALPTLGFDELELRRQRAELTLFEQSCALLREAGLECRRRGWLTFGDLLTEPIRLLRHDALARDVLRGEYRHAVVDEFQDVNEATIVFLKELFPSANTPDLCVVGDDDQAIYAFRGADDRSFEKFASHWPGAAVVKLEENYRSAAPIIAAANAVIARATDRFAPDKIIRRAETKTKPDLPGSDVVAVTLEYTRAGEAIAAMLLRERAAAPNKPWDKHAVIARGHTDLDRIALTLIAEGIPVMRQRAVSAIDDPGVADLFAWLRSVTDGRDVTSVRRLLLRPPVALDGPRVLEIERRYHALARAHEADPEGSQHPGDYAPFAVAACADVAAAQRFGTLWHEVRSRVAGMAADEFLHDLVLRTNVVHADLLPGKERGERLGAVVRLLRFARERQRRLAEPGDARAFLDYFDDLAANDQSEMGDLAERVEGGTTDDAPEGVRLITAHSAKGLEFDTVFVPRVESMHGYPSKRAREDDGHVPAALLHPGGAPDARDVQAAEERRVFYVACTRAERRLVLLGKAPTKKSASVNYLAELVADLRAMPVLDGEDVIATWRPGEGSAVVREAQQRVDLDRRRAAGASLAAAARIRAARALELARDPGLDAAGLKRVRDELAAAAEELAVIAHAEETGEKPAWAKGALADAIVARLGPVTEQPIDAGIVMPAPKPPLELSYSSIEQYEKCPGCWYMRFVLRLSEVEKQEAALGTLAHAALCEFYGRWQRADAEGTELPTTNDLVALGKKMLLSQRLRTGVEADELRKLSEMLRTAHDVFHAQRGEGMLIESPEWRVTIPYEHLGTHHLTASIDRLEQLEGGSGAFRIVDYKTGKAWKSLTDPKKDDLQLGLYALILDHALGDGTPVTGWAEYWLLASKQIGAIRLETLDRAKVRSRINSAIEGILAGRFTPAPGCVDKGGLCRLLRPGVAVEPA